jgi:hypothetical protein
VLIRCRTFPQALEHGVQYLLHLTPGLFVASMQSFEKLQKTTTEQQQVTTQLMQERQLLQQQIQLLQQQSRDQADKLRRTQLQKQRLEALCRTLQTQVCSHRKPCALGIHNACHMEAGSALRGKEAITACLLSCCFSARATGACADMSACACLLQGRCGAAGGTREGEAAAQPGASQSAAAAGGEDPEAAVAGNPADSSGADTPAAAHLESGATEAAADDAATAAAGCQADAAGGAAAADIGVSEACHDVVQDVLDKILEK